VTYNHAKYIRECLESVVNQEVPFTFEVVVGDDASTDGTTDILLGYAQLYPHMIRPIVQTQNLGVGRNWQTVLDSSRGDLLAHLDGDDMMLPNKLARQVAYMDAHPDVAMSFHNMLILGSSTRREILFTSSGAPKLRHLDDVVRYGTVYCHSSKMYRRASLPAGGLDLRTTRVMDWMLHIQNAAGGEIGYMDEVLGVYRRHTTATTASRSVADLSASLADQLLATMRASELGASEDAVAFGTSRVLLRTALRYLDAGEWALFKDSIERSYQTRRLSLAQEILFAIRGAPRVAKLLARVYRSSYLHKMG